MPTLCVLRHAKSDWATGAADHDRPLNARGRAAAPLVGRWLRDRGLRPAIVLCSSARRARDTLEALGELGGAGVEVSDDLYLASASGWLEHLRRLPGDVSPVLAVGHNPGMQRLVVRLAGQDEARDVAAAFPTAALAVLEIDGPWERVAEGSARLTAFVRPRDLE